MIDLYTWATPNGRKISIMLEELALPYAVHPINIGESEQFEPGFLKISPNNKIPVIVDHDTGASVFESGTILIYLADKAASPLLPADGALRSRVLEWLFFQAASIGPMFGQLGHFALYAKVHVPYAIKRYTDEAIRIFNVIEKRLGEEDYLAGAYSIADIAAYPWLAYVYDRLDELDPSVRPSLKNTAGWLDRVGARPAVQKGMKVPE